MLKKVYRIRKNKDFHAVYGKKNTVAAKTVVLYIMDNHTGVSRAGFSVSKRIGNAVVRNRCRRMMSEAVRLHFGEISPGTDCIFVGRKPIAKADFQQVEEDVLYTLERKGRLASRGSGRFPYPSAPPDKKAPAYREKAGLETP